MNKLYLVSMASHKGVECKDMSRYEKGQIGVSRQPGLQNCKTPKQQCFLHAVVSSYLKWPKES